MELNWIDIIVGIPLLYGLISGLYKGIVQSIGSLVGLVLGIVVAYFFAEPLSYVMEEWFALAPSYGYTISFVVLFVAVMLICMLLVKLITKLLSAITLGWLNRVLGACFGLLKIALLLSVLVNLLDNLDQKVGWIQPEKKQASWFYNPVKQVVPTLMPYVHFYLDSQHERTK